FSKAIQLDPSLGDAYYHRARVYYASDDIEGSIEDLTSAIELTPRSPNLYLTRGRVYVTAGDTAKAVADLEQVLALTENEALAVAARQLLALVQ
ncbi:MAG: tetratricopeptide repeat protein, partial [Chloroflexi bacterium]|nr:tetratricopeptide repeat protein [Chloroflexota bacterium]